jgi:hypothetical protein
LVPFKKYRSICVKFLENTKSHLGERAIRRILKNRKRKVVSCSIDNAKKIGIIFNATHQVSFEIVKELVKNLSKNRKSIEVLGFVDSKHLIDHYLYRKGFDFFTQNQLNWYYKPKSENIDKFINKPFDILLDLSLDDPFPIRYILACSEAKFKAGRYSEDQEHLDFMIDIEKEKSTMNEIRSELAKNETIVRRPNKEVEKIVNEKVKTEIQLNFLINQLLHYLSLIKN